MCGRFILTDPATALHELLGLDLPDSLAPLAVARFNIAPSQQVLAVRQDKQGEREVASLHWGLIPFWAKDPNIGYRMINARAETVAKKPAFRRALEKRRCLIPANGFYEWAAVDGKPKNPYLIQIGDKKPFCFAGLWERWRPEGAEPVESFTILTTTPNERIAALHDRMPVILEEDRFEPWLAVGEDVDLSAMLAPYPAEAMSFYPVSKHVNTPKNDDPSCIDEIVLDDPNPPPSTLTLPF